MAMVVDLYHNDSLFLFFAMLLLLLLEEKETNIYVSDRMINEIFFLMIIAERERESFEREFREREFREREFRERERGIVRRSNVCLK